MATIKNATLTVWIYTGEFGTKDTENPSYVLFKEAQPNQENIVFQISELVKDYVDVEFNGDYTQIKQSAWVEWEMVRVYDDDTNDTLKGSIIAFTGYGYFEDGVNPQLSSGVLISNDNIFYDCADNLHIPVLGGLGGVFDVIYKDASGTIIGEETIPETFTIIRASTTLYRADTTELTADLTQIPNSSSEPTISITAPNNVREIVFNFTDGSSRTILARCLDCGKYDYQKVSFVNKFGVVQDIWFDKKRTDSSSIQKDQYLQSTIKSNSTGVDYSLNQASKIPDNFRVNKSLTLNTGFVTEDYNEVIQQLLLTERAWIHEKDNVFPIIPKTSQLEYKTKLNEKLINFTVDFDYAYNEINLIK